MSWAVLFGHVAHRGMALRIVPMVQHRHGKGSGWWLALGQAVCGLSLVSAEAEAPLADCF